MCAIINKVFGRRIASFEITENPKLFYFSDESIEKAELTIYDNGIGFSSNTNLSRHFYGKNAIVSAVFRENKGYIRFANGEEIILGATGTREESIGGSCASDRELTKRLVELVNELKSGFVLHETDEVIIENIKRWRAIKFSRIFALVIVVWFLLVSTGHLTTNFMLSILLGLPAAGLVFSYIKVHSAYKKREALTEIWFTAYWAIFIFIGIVILAMLILQWAFGIIL